MKLKKVLIVSLALCLGLVGCTNKTSENKITKNQEIQQVNGDNIESTSDSIKGGEQVIVLNQIGYLPSAVKKVVFRTGEVGDVFKVVDVNTNEVVYTSTLEQKIYSVMDDQLTIKDVV